MNLADWQRIKGLAKALLARRPEPTRQAERIVAMQLHIVLPSKAGVIAVALYYLFYSGAFTEEPTPRWVFLEMLQNYFLVYVFCNAVAGLLFWQWRRFPPGIFQWAVFTLGLLDGMFVGGLAFITGGFGSIAYWIFPGLIVLNAISIPLATPQLVLNLLLSLFYLSAGLLYVQIGDEPIYLMFVPGRSNPSQPSFLHPAGRTNALAPGGVVGPASRSSQPSLLRPAGRTNAAASGVGEGLASRFHRSSPHWDDSTGATRDQNLTEPVSLHLSVLWLLTACCYWVQVLAERQRRALEEAREFALREGQLHSAGRLAAEFAHQIKNPLAIINNAAFSLQRALKEGRNDAARQIQIIQEEVERSDRIVTQILGYAQLNEGRVEKLVVTEELDYAISQVFPPAADFQIRVTRRYGADLPPLLMQRRHLSDILVNLLQNAREALHGRGAVGVSAECLPEDAIEIIISDNGPGIPADKTERIFEASYTTKEKGTGLGLAMVKHNTELYGGIIRVESELGKGARFILAFPAKTAISLARQR